MGGCATCKSTERDGIKWKMPKKTYVVPGGHAGI